MNLMACMRFETGAIQHFPLTLYYICAMACDYSPEFEKETELDTDYLKDKRECFNVRVRKEVS